jgi:UDP-N-acetylmuramoylalanine--D-glutamate ligase
MKELLVILGAGESGTGAALLAQAKGWDVFVSDFGTIAPKFKEQLTQAYIAFEEGKHTEAVILNASLVIKSPGIPYKVPIIKALQAKGIAIIDELEFAYRYSKAKFICITGSNGKTTTTLLTYHLLKEAGFNVALGGNIGQSMALQVINETADWYVLEVSSFQLDGWDSFKPNISAITNITPDHLDRYDYKFENYVASKFRIVQQQDENDYFITFSDAEVIEQELAKGTIKPTTALIGNQEISGLGAYSKREEAIVFNYLDSEAQLKHFELSLANAPIQGAHNRQNIMVAVLAALRAGVLAESIEGNLSTFINAPHRLEKVATINGVTYVNDSKATNVDSVKYALGTYSEPLVWIAGGVDKGNDYSLIESLVLDKVKVLIILGSYKEPLLKAFSGKLPLILEAADMQEAINLAQAHSQSGDVVLLSPACASFDLFKNYEHRGDVFRELVLSALNPR